MHTHVPKHLFHGEFKKKASKEIKEAVIFTKTRTPSEVRTTSSAIEVENLSQVQLKGRLNNAHVFGDLQIKYVSTLSFFLTSQRRNSNSTVDLLNSGRYTHTAYHAARGGNMEIS